MATPEFDPTERFLRACRGEPVDRPPVWLMRQAGRYLPEYRALREGITFLDMCRDVDRAVEVSLQPLRRVGTEAVIFFSDIFVPVLGLGVEIDFQPGPLIAQPIRSLPQVEALRRSDPREAVPYVFEILRRLRRELEPARIPLLGFAGAPFTLAAYLIEGRGSKDFSQTKRMMYRAPDLLERLLERLGEMTGDYLAAQAEAGAQALQLFDTWAGLLAPRDYVQWVLPSHRRLAARLKDLGIPLILYTNTSSHVLEYMAESGFDVVSLDWRVEMADASRRIGAKVSLQGNLDPCALQAPAPEIHALVRQIAEGAAGARGHILNLGHGCLPDTPVEGVQAFTEAARALGPRR